MTERPAARGGQRAGLEEGFVGIDVAIARSKRLPVCVAVRRGRALVPLPLRAPDLPKPPSGMGNTGVLDAPQVEAFADETLAYLEALASALSLSLRVVALDCPSAPRLPHLARRAAEAAMDARRIHCFTTPDPKAFEGIRRLCRTHLSKGGARSRMPHANQLWMLAGFALFSRLARAGYTCREVFPQAIVRGLGVGATHKSRAEGYRAQLAAAASSTGHTPGGLARHLSLAGWGSRHDRLDAFLSAWVASLPVAALEACGDPPADVIWLPRRTRGRAAR